MIMCIQNLVSICLFFLKILSKNRILTSIKNANSVANLRKTMIYNTNMDIVNEKVHTKFGLNWSFCFQDIEQKLNSDDDPPHGRGQFRPQGHDWQDLCRVPLNSATF